MSRLAKLSQAQLEEIKKFEELWYNVRLLAHENHGNPPIFPSSAEEGSTVGKRTQRRLTDLQTVCCQSGQRLLFQNAKIIRRMLKADKVL